MYLVEGLDQENKPSLIRDKIRSKNLSMNGYHNINGKLLAKKNHLIFVENRFIKDLVVVFLYSSIFMSGIWKG